MTLSLSVQDKDLHLSPHNHNGSPQPYQSPISPDSPDNIEKSDAPLMSYKGPEKPSMIVSAQCVDDLTENADFYAMTKRDAKLKHHIRIFKFLLRLLTFLFALYDLTTMIYTLNLFLRTYLIRRTLYLPPTPITRGPWHADSKNWPTFLLLAVSSISCLASFLILALYLRSVAAANKAAARFGQLAYTIFAAHVVVWIATAVAYRKGKDGTDLWGWSCTYEARVVLQPFFRDVVDFGLLCRIQTSSWAISVAQAALTSLNLMLYWISYQRHRTKTGLKSLTPTSSRVNSDHRDAQDMMAVDHEKEQGIRMSEKARKEGIEEQKQHMIGNGNGNGIGAEQMVAEEEPVPLRKAIRKPAFRALLGYITTFVGVFN